MTNVIVNAIDVLGQEIDEGVVRISAADAQYNGGSLMLPEYHEQELVAGSTTITGVTSGKVVVTLHWGINRTATFRVYVPDTTEITLAELALQKYDSDPAVVSKVADAALRAEDAADRAGEIADDFGSLEGVMDQVQIASDAASSASGSASAASSSASAAATSESNAAGSASSAGTSASSAASSASDAAGSASTASGAAASTAGSASQAASSATAAASSASAAASSASTAEDAAERAEAGASTVGDAQTILAARDQAVTAKDGAVTAQTAAEAAATSAASAAATEVNKLKAGAPEAFDTLLEIANELEDNETERAALANSIAAKAEKVYVDGELDKKANTAAVPVTDGGYGTHHVSDPAADYPRGVSYGLFNATDESWNAAIQADTGYANYSTFVMVLTLRQGGYTMSTTQMVFSYNHLDRPVFTRKWHDGAWGPFRSLTDDGHTHTSANITDARTWTGRSTDSDAIVKTDPDGWFFVGSAPTHGSHPTNKSYVDGGLAGKADTSHQHKVLDFPMTDRTNWINNSSHPGKFVYTRPDGYLHGDVPTDTSHVANKQYVDARTPEIRAVTTIPASPTPGVVYLKFG